ncbi:MAG: hypothetical protein J3Q66DRAFT_126761 [Benniella sp.]|nr:MAG: hypothetical protein J3Q66DRAFT_362460 [Benniella sp.]KAK3804638.1 MAG: hypothetical protein J3Q66DRAFT_361988 [Benniella sp.]KAK3804651.1 MAG: hypothetical protein J3Q66DRAFT_362061 [Benniella sp.]KAK3805635.1 MAG: hypothetical protein J3Q66DRAFT_126761 [Benniella sp.]
MGIGVLRQDRCLARRTQGAGRLAGSHTFGSDFKIPSCHMIHTNLEVRNPSSSEISVFTGRIHSLVSLIRITPTTAARHTAVVALASLFGVDWSRGPTVTSSGSHGLLSYLASPINPRAMASVKNPAPLTLIELSELSSISITAATASGGAAGSAVHAIVTLGRKTPFMCPDLSEVWWACRPWPILLELLEELEGIFQVDGEKAE